MLKVSVTNASPTWYGDIRKLFTKRDTDHMRGQGVILDSYDYVKDHAGQIYQQVAAKNMPPSPPGKDNSWPDEWVETFHAWMKNGCPKGTPNQSTLFAKANLLMAAAPVTPAGRIRKDITLLSDDEYATLGKAFKGIMEMDPEHVNSYFYQAAIHWYPSPNTWCMHHVPGYNPWHRAYLLGFENALRSVPGCENVTLPYWDITTPFPDRLKQAPFDAYIYQRNVGPAPYYELMGQKTYRQPYDKIEQFLNEKYKVPDLIKNAMSLTDWEDFHGLIAGAPNIAIIRAHDCGHNSIGGTDPGTFGNPEGGTMTDQHVAAFDPVFWFFHCNWDRLWWKWQHKMEATTLNGLLSTINRTIDKLSYQTFTDPDVMKLAPFTLTAVDVVDSVKNLDVDYAEPAAPHPPLAMQLKTKLASPTTHGFVVNPNFVDVRVNGINRLKIPGSFDVHLTKNGSAVATAAFFQPNEAEKCASCVQNALVHFDFRLPVAEVLDGELGIVVEPVNKEMYGEEFPSKLMGNPTVEVKFVVSNEQ